MIAMNSKLWILCDSSRSQAGDSFATARVCVALLDACIAANDYKELTATVQLLAKKRG